MHFAVTFTGSQVRPAEGMNTNEQSEHQQPMCWLVSFIVFYRGCVNAPSPRVYFSTRFSGPPKKRSKCLQKNFHIPETKSVHLLIAASKIKILLFLGGGSSDQRANICILT